MPLITTFSEVRLGRGQQGLTVCTADLSVREGIRSAVTQLPIAHGRFGDIHEEGNTGSQYAYQSDSNPSGAGIEGRDESISNARPGVNGT